MGELSAAAYTLPLFLETCGLVRVSVRENELKDWIIGRYKVKVKESFGFHLVSLSWVADPGDIKATAPAVKDFRV